MTVNMAASVVENLQLDELKAQTRRKLIRFLESIPNKKDLVLDPDLIVALDNIAGAKLLKDHGVEKMFKLEPHHFTQGSYQRVYIIKPELSKAKMVADHINADKSRSVRVLKHVTVVMVPRKLYCCEQLLEYEGVWGDITITSLDLGLLVIDSDLLSLEIPSFVRDFYLNEDYTWLHTIAKSICSLQSVFGLIPNLYGQGKGSKLVQELMKVLQDSKSYIPSDKIGNLFLIDRDVDYVSPLLTQLTYQGQLDETFTIKSGYVVLEPEITGRKGTTKVLLNADDKVFEEIKDYHMSKAFDVLVARVKDLVTDSKKRAGMSLGEVKQFVSSGLKQQQHYHNSVSLHVSTCEAIVKRKAEEGLKNQLAVERGLVDASSYRNNVNYVEELIVLRSPLEKCLRLICLLSCTNDGLSSKDFHNLRTKFLQSFGHEHLLTFFNLQKMGLLADQDAKLALNKFTITSSVPLSSSSLASSKLLVGKVASVVAQRTGRTSFHSVCRRLNLISNEDADLNNPVDLAYVFGGSYIPLACNLVHQVVDKEGFGGLEETMKFLPGSTISEIKAKSARKGSVASGQVLSATAARVVLVFFIGGVTYAEVAAFRLMGRLRGYRFIIATTSIINGNFLMESAMESVTNCTQKV